MTLAHATVLLILLTIAVWIVWDWHALTKGGYDATETALIRKAAQYPLVPLAVGVLLGHLFACG